MKDSEKNNSSLQAVLPEDVSLDFLQEVKKTVERFFALCVRVLNQSWRQGTVKCKGRSDLVSRSNKKPWKQKGTGRARAGSARSPLWRGGGVSFGPQPRTKVFSVTKKIKKKTFLALCKERFTQKAVYSLDWEPSGDRPSTATMCKKLEQIGLYAEPITFFVSFGDEVVASSLSNIKSVTIVFFDQPDVINLSRKGNWVFLKKDFNEFKKMVSAWL